MNSWGRTARDKALDVLTSEETSFYEKEGICDSFPLLSLVSPLLLPVSLGVSLAPDQAVSSGFSSSAAMPRRGQ